MNGQSSEDVFVRLGVGAVMMPRQTSRKLNAGAIQVLAFQRSTFWELPQGGIKPNELDNRLQAAYREILEETGIERQYLTYRGLYAPMTGYIVPPERRRPEIPEPGQIHEFYFFDFFGDVNAINLSMATTHEFSALQSISFRELCTKCAEFKVATYRVLAEHAYERFFRPCPQIIPRR
jgi:8-oxo-dGTP pyrophosphatase MutT (NUDIX family)